MAAGAGKADDTSSPPIRRALLCCQMEAIMTLKAGRYISVSERKSRRRIMWRVSVKECGGDWNSLDRTLAEEFVHSKSAADRLAARWSREYNADLPKI